MKKIVIPKWLREESPVCAGFCEVINAALEENEKMSLLEFAEALSEANKEKSLERLERAERKQFGREERA